jgi:hypothetical protein
MAAIDQTPQTDRRPTVWDSLNRQVSGFWCALSWLAASAVYFGFVALMGGPTKNDSTESVYSTWAIAHARFTCAFPPVTPVTRSFLPDYAPGPHVAPLWPLVSGGIAALFRIGHSVPFPSLHAMGPNCSQAYPAMYQWADISGSHLPTIGIGYIAWFALLTGVVAVLRSSGRGRTGWEVASVLLVALTPIVWMPVLDQYHPQDLVALGLILVSVACFMNDRWIWAGLCIGLASTSQQFALLALIALFFVAPGHARWRLVAASAGCAAIVSLSMVAVTAGQAWDAIAIGSGDFKSLGGTVVWELGLHGAHLVIVSRILPLAAAAALSWWLVRRIGSRALDPLLLLSLVGTCLTFRLVFEENLYGYYFLPLVVFLILMDVVRGQLRGQLLAWAALVSVIFNPIPFGLSPNGRSWGLAALSDVHAIFIGTTLCIVLWDAAHRLVRPYIVATLLMAIYMFGTWPPWSAHFLNASRPLWTTEIILVGAGLALVAEPLGNALRDNSASRARSTKSNVSRTDERREGPGVRDVSSLGGL